MSLGVIPVSWESQGSNHSPVANNGMVFVSGGCEWAVALLCTFLAMFRVSFLFMLIGLFWLEQMCNLNDNLLGDDAAALVLSRTHLSPSTPVICERKRRRCGLWVE